MWETAEKDPSTTGVSEGLSFLCVLNFLEITSDLVLAIPACAAAIHRYNPQNSKSSRASKVIQSMQHAMHGCSPPSRNFVNYVLHCLLPQPRVEPSHNENSWDHESMQEYQNYMAKKREAFMRSKISQSAARLLVALVARSGEGRRRVITDLALSLSGNITSCKEFIGKERNDDTSMWALQVRVF